MRLLERPPVVAHPADKLARRDHRHLARLQVPEQSLGHRQYLVGIDRPARRDHQPLGAIFLFQPRRAVRCRRRANRRLAPQHRPRDRLAPVHRLEQMVVDQVIGLVHRLAQLGQDDQLLPLQLGLVHLGRSHQIGDQPQREADVGAQHPRMKGRLIARRPRIERPANIFNTFGNCLGIAPARTLEDHMLDEVRQAAKPLDLGPRPDAGIQPDRRRLRPRHGVGRDRQAVPEPMQRGAHLPFVSGGLASALTVSDRVALSGNRRSAIR